jgi:peptide/nickel transport system substrate-binding protein
MGASSGKPWHGPLIGHDPVDGRRRQQPEVTRIVRSTIVAAANRWSEAHMSIGRHSLAMVGATIATLAWAGPQDNSLHFAVEQVLDNIDPYFNQQRAGFNFAHQVWDTLLYRDPVTGEFKGQLSKSWRTIDERTIEFELRSGVKFHNGADFDARDVVSTIDFVTNPQNRVVRQAQIGWIARAEMLDLNKVRIIAKAPFPAAMEYIASYLFIYPHEYYSNVGPQGMSEKPVGTGPFRVAEHARGKYIHLQRYPDYFKESPKPQPKIDKLDIRFVPDLQTQMAEMLAGRLDMIWNVTVDQAQQLRAGSDLQVVSGDTLRIAYLHINGSDTTPSPPLRDVRVRRAIMYAIDRNSMVKTIVPEGALLLNSFCHPSQFGCSPVTMSYTFDPAKARALLAEAGFENGFDVELYASNLRDRLQTEAIIGYLRAVGIRATLRFVQNAASRSARRAGKVALEHGTWGPSIYDVSATAPAFFGANPDNMNRDEEVRDLLALADNSLDPKVRYDAYGKALTLINERAYMLPLFTIPVYYIARKDLRFTAYLDEVTRFWEMSYK